MTAVTVDLPETLVQQIQEREIPQERLKQIVIRAIESYLREPGLWSYGFDTSGGAVEPEAFARRVIANNRELFEELAHL